MHVALSTQNCVASSPYTVGAAETTSEKSEAQVRIGTIPWCWDVKCLKDTCQTQLYPVSSATDLYFSTNIISIKNKSWRQRHLRQGGFFAILTRAPFTSPIPQYSALCWGSSFLPLVNPDITFSPLFLNTQRLAPWISNQIFLLLGTLTYSLSLLGSLKYHFSCLLYFEKQFKLVSHAKSFCAEIIAAKKGVVILVKYDTLELSFFHYDVNSKHTHPLKTVLTNKAMWLK